MMWQPVQETADGQTKLRKLATYTLDWTANIKHDRTVSYLPQMTVIHSLTLVFMRFWARI